MSKPHSLFITSEWLLFLNADQIGTLTAKFAGCSTPGEQSLISVTNQLDATVTPHPLYHPIEFTTHNWKTRKKTTH